MVRGHHRAHPRRAGRAGAGGGHGRAGRDAGRRHAVHRGRGSRADPHRPAPDLGAQPRRPAGGERRRARPPAAAPIPRPAYYQTIEEFFVSRRGDPLFLSNADWLLIRKLAQGGHAAARRPARDRRRPRRPRALLGPQAQGGQPRLLRGGGGRGARERWQRALAAGRRRRGRDAPRRWPRSRTRSTAGTARRLRGEAGRLGGAGCASAARRGHAACARSRPWLAKAEAALLRGAARRGRAPSGWPRSRPRRTPSSRPTRPACRPRCWRRSARTRSRAGCSPRFGLPRLTRVRAGSSARGLRPGDRRRARRSRRRVYRGQGLGRHEGQVVFVPRGRPGRPGAGAHRVRDPGLRARAAVEELLRAAARPPRRAVPALRALRGLRLPALDYAAQLALKEAVLRETLGARGRARGTGPSRCTPSPEEGWRTRASLHVAARRRPASAWACTRKAPPRGGPRGVPAALGRR